MIAGLPDESTFIKLSDYKTTFWRYQHYDVSCLATVESIYYFYKELVKAYQDKGIHSADLMNIDDLLLLYAVQFINMKQDVEHVIKENGHFVNLCDILVWQAQRLLRQNHEA